MKLKLILLLLCLPLVGISQIPRFPGSVPDPIVGSGTNVPKGGGTLLFAGDSPIVWEESAGTSYDENSTVLSKVSAVNGWDAQTKSVATVPSNVQGFVKYTVESTSGTKYLGFAPELADGYKKKDIELLLLFKNSKMRIFHQGKLVSQVNVSVSDKIKMKRTVNGNGVWKLKVLKNGALLYKVNTIGENEIYAYAGIKTVGSVFTNVKGDAFLKVKATQTVLANATTGDLGTIQLNVIGGVPPYTYLWSDRNFSNELTAEPGHYSVGVADAEGNVATKLLTMWSTIDWTNPVNYQQVGTNISSTGANGSAQSTNMLIPGNLGVLQYEADNTQGVKYLGFRDKHEPTFASFNGFLFVANRAVVIINGRFSGVSNYKTGDIFKLRIEEDGKIKFFKNPKGPKKATKLGTGAINYEEPQQVVVRMITPGVGFKDVKVSFGAKPNIMPIVELDAATGDYNLTMHVCGKVTEPVYYAIDQPILDETAYDVANASLNDLYAAAGITPPTLLHADYLAGFTSTDFTGLTPGVYTLYISDSDGNTAETPLVIGAAYEAGVETGVTVTADKWEMTDAATGFADAEIITNNYIEPGETGAFEFAIEKDHEAVVGFKEIDVLTSGEGLADLRYGYLFSDGTISSVVDGAISFPGNEELLFLPETDIKILKGVNDIQLYVNRVHLAEYDISLTVVTRNQQLNQGARQQNTQCLGKLLTVNTIPRDGQKFGTIEVLATGAIIPYSGQFFDCLNGSFVNFVSTSSPPTNAFQITCCESGTEESVEKGLRLKVAFGKGPAGNAKSSLKRPLVGFRRRPPVLTLFEVQHGSCSNPADNEVFAVNYAFPLGFTVVSEEWKNSAGDVMSTSSSMANVAPGIYTYDAVLSVMSTSVLVSEQIVIGVKANWQDVTHATQGVYPNEDQLNGTSGGLGTAITDNVIKSDLIGTLVVLPNDDQPTSGDFVLFVGFVNESLSGPTFQGALLHDAMGGGGAFLNLMIFDPLSGSGPTTAWVRDRKDVTFVSDGAGNIQVSYKNVFGLSLSQQIAAPAGSGEYKVRAFTGNDANSFLERAYMTFECPTRPYAELRKKLDGGYAIVEDGTLRFVYDEQYNDQDGKLNYFIYNEYNDEVIPSVVTDLTPVYGDNRMDLDLSCSGIGINSGFYTLEVINEKNEKLYLRFRNDQNYICNTLPDPK